MPAICTSPPFSETSACAIFGTVSVVIIACATSGNRLSSRSSNKLRQRGHDQVRVHLDADDTSRCGQDLRHRHLEMLGDGTAACQALLHRRSWSHSSHFRR